MEPAEILWSDSSCHQARFEKSAAALVAVPSALAEGSEEPTEFQSLYEFVAEARADHFSTLWYDPAAYFWSRRAVHFLAANMGARMGLVELAYCTDVGASGPADALRIHLAEFKRFALGLALLSGRELAFAKPYLANLPVTFPGTELAITGSGDIAIHGASPSYIDATYAGNRLTMSLGNSAALDPRIVRCPVVEVDGLRLVLNPVLFRLPGIGLSREWVQPEIEFQNLHVAELKDALGLVARHQPQTFNLMRHGMRALALKSMREGTFSSLSSSELPGAFICSVPCDRFELAATLIHEFYHNRLYAIEEAGAFFSENGEDPIEGEHHYSPWRNGPRPLHGLLHAIYVYLPLFRFWVAAMAAQRLKGEQLGYATDQLARIPVQLRIGVNQLRRFGEFTSFGAALFEQLAAETTAAEAQAGAIGISLDSPAYSLRTSGCLRPVLESGSGCHLSVGKTLRDHLASHDVRGECREERASIERALGWKLTT